MLVEDDFAAARTDLESAAALASRKGILNTAAFSFAYLARTEWMVGAWDDALLHAEEAPRAAANLGNLLADQGDIEGAKNAYQKAIDSGQAEAAPNKQGNLQTEKGDLEGAKNATRRPLTPDTPPRRRKPQSTSACCLRPRATCRAPRTPTR